MSEASTISAWSRNLRLAVVAIIAVATASAIGHLATYPNLAPWYAGGVRSGLDDALCDDGNCCVARPEVAGCVRRAGLALTLFFIQLVLNAAWSWMFFAANNPLLGVINIILQFLVILATVVEFYRLDRMAAWCLVPLAVWVAFAGVLNVAIWRLNG